VGLALCKAAIEAHGGDIKVRSEGIGATFTVLLSTS
jgi:signal transduction histidine kinase